MNDYRYEIAFEYSRYFENLHELWKHGNLFHETLRGNPDYIENRIILNIDESKHLLTVTQFRDSDTDIWVDHFGAKRVPVLRIGVRHDV